MGMRIKQMQKKQPVASKQLADQYQAGADMRLQQTVAAAPTTPTTKSVAQTFGGQAAGEAAKATLSREQMGAQQRRSLAGMETEEARRLRTGNLQEKQLQTSAREFDLGMLASKFEREGRGDLADRANELQELRNTNKFQNSMKEIQLLEGIAGSERELKEYLQIVDQHSREEIADMEAVRDALIQEIKQMGASERAELERQSGMSISDLMKDTNAKIDSAKQDMENSRQVMKGFTGVMGAAMKYGG